MNTRSYNQFCGLATALDAVGERWTLLIIRELLSGPRRFKDLMDGLPGISTNLLSERLKELEQRELLRRRALPPPAGSTVYELTPAGQSLETVVIQLGRWGARYLPSSLEGLSLPSVSTAGLAMKSRFHPERAQEIDEIYQLDFGSEVLQVQIKCGELRIQPGETLKPDVIFRAGMASFVPVFVGHISAEEAIASGSVQVEGDPQAFYRFINIFERK